MATKSVNKPKTLEVIQGELYVFGNKLPRHPEFPWLFSATALHKFCEKAIRNDAKRNQLDDEKYYNAKRPSQWLRRNVFGENNTEQVAYWSKYTRRRIKKYGPNLGFAERQVLKRDVTVTAVTVRLGELSDLETVCVTVNGGSGPSSLKGTYICQHIVVEYVGTFSPKFKAAVSDIFLSVLNGEVDDVVEKVLQSERIARGTPAREEDKAWSNEFKHSVAGKHASVPQAEAGLNLGTLGMSGKKWMEKNDAGLPIQDYFTPHQLKVRKTAIVDVVCDLAEDKRPKIASGEIKQKCFVAGIRAKAIWEDPSIKDALDKVVAAKVKEYEEKRKLKVAKKRKPA